MSYVPIPLDQARARRGLAPWRGSYEALRLEAEAEVAAIGQSLEAAHLGWLVRLARWLSGATASTGAR